MTTLPNNVDYAFRVYGDNILECLILIEWLDHSEESGFIQQGKTGPIDRPIFIYKSAKSDFSYAFQLCPYYGGTGRRSLWPTDPIGEWSAEKPDVVVTRVLEDGTQLKPTLAIEFCDALQAGNQAWQRFRRAYDSATAGIPYFYVLPLIGWERDSGGLALKGARYQSAQITLAQLALCSKLGTPSLQIYTGTSWVELAERYDHPVPNKWSEFADIKYAVQYAGLLLREVESSALQQEKERINALTPIFNGMLQVAKTYGKHLDTKFTLHTERPLFKSEEDIEKASKTYAQAVSVRKPVEGEYALHNINHDDLKNKGALFFKDAQNGTTTPRFRDGFLKWLNWRDSFAPDIKQAYLEKWNVNLSGEMLPASIPSSRLNEIARSNRDKLPVTYKEGKSEAAFVQNRKVLRDILATTYPKLSQTFLKWVEGNNNENRPLLTVPFYGYKPSGDSRPDRGLLPNLAALFPDLTADRNILVVMYSINTPKNWRHLLSNEGNELWNVIRVLAGGLIVDVTQEGLLINDNGLES